MNPAAVALLVMGLAGIAGSTVAATGQAVYEEKCGSCHTAGAAGAPRLGDTAEWTRRIRAGRETLYRSALQGMLNTAMPAKGGSPALTETEVKAAVDYITERARLPAAVLQAAAARRATHPEFLRLDTDGDDYLSRAEAAQDRDLNEVFARYDADRDGRLSEAEFLALDAALLAARAAVVVDDATLAVAVAQALAQTKGIPAGIKAGAAAGVVTLTGAIDSGEEARLAEAVVRRVPGVQRIDNRLISKHALGFD
ncbi:MAG: c-type cytochrome [Burkholderiales bacterium]